jgi:hypothetical protein
VYDELLIMLRMVFVGLLGALAGVAQTVTLPSNPAVAIFLGFDAAPSRLSLESMKNEVTRIMAPTGFKLYWRSLQENPGTESFSDIVVMKFRGKCSLRTPAPEPPEGEVTLAKTEVENGTVLPFSEVACDEVARIVPKVRGNNQKAFGTALGRVVAHELYHFLANATRHAAQGLAKQTQTAWDLTTGTLGFEPADNRAMMQHSFGVR